MVWGAKQRKFEVLAWPPNSSDLKPVELLWDVLDKQGGHSSQMTGLKGCAAVVSVPDTRAHLQSSGEVCASMSHSGFDCKRKRIIMHVWKFDN